MSSIGKIFVVVNLVLSLLLLGSLGSLLNAARETKDDVTRLQSELAAAQEEFAQAESDFNTRKRQLDGEKNSLQNEKQDLADERDAAQRNLASERESNQQLRNDLSQLTASFDQLQQSVDAKDQRNRELQTLNDDYRTQAQEAQAQAADAEQSRRDLEEQIAGFEGQIAQLDDELTNALDRARKAEGLVDVAKAAGFDVNAIVAPVAVDATVVQVDQEFNFVILDKGSDQGIERGLTLDVVRGGEYLGQVRVDSVEPGYSTATIVLSKAPMQARDRATTRL